jgi:TolB-like protein
MRALLPALILVLMSGPAAADITVAVLEFTNASSDPGLAPLGKGLQSMLTTDLSAVAAIQLVERSRLQEIQQEIDLGGSGAVDPDTAVRFGRLAGATHLLAGSFTVVGDRMRLDARLFDVEKGTVALGEEITGETEAFFELEKELVRKLIASLGLSLAPRERAAVARIHTADFGAFSSFSRGIDLFDQKAYDDALAQLRDATAADEDFKLARVTLSEYEHIIGELRSRRDELSTARDQLRRLEKLQSAQGEARIVTRLFEIAAWRGPSAQRERLTALYLLTTAYATLSRNKGTLMDLRSSEDKWAMARTADTLAASYFTEARELWPAIPLVIDGDWFYRGLPEEETFDKDFADAVETLWEDDRGHPDNRTNALTSPLRYPWKMASLLHLDRAEEVRLREELIQAGLQLDPSDYWQKEQKEALAEDLRLVLRLDESTALFTRDVAGEDNPYVLEGVAREVERNRDYEALLQRAKDPAMIREWLLGAAGGLGWSQGQIVKQAEDHFLGTSVDAEGLKLLDRLRKSDFGADKPLLLGRHPLWAMQASSWLRSGRRTDARRFAALRYYKDRDSNQETDTIVLLDGVPREDLRASFQVDFARPADLHNSRIEKDGWTEGRPWFGFIFGVRDVRVDKQEDASGERVVSRPTTQWMVALTDSQVQLLRMTESVRGSYGRKNGWDETVLGTAALKWPRNKPAKVVIHVSGRTVKVTVAGKAHSFAVATDRSGFYGFQFRGIGYVELAAVGVD